jgi:hypothetical protein
MNPHPVVGLVIARMYTGLPATRDDHAVHFFLATMALLAIPVGASMEDATAWARSAVARASEPDAEDPAHLGLPSEDLDFDPEGLVPFGVPPGAAIARTAEARAALTDCATYAAPFQMREYRRRLLGLAAEYPNLAGVIGCLQQVIDPTGS